MGVQAQIERLMAAKTAIVAAIEDKGVDVPDDATLDALADYIVQIKTTITAGTVQSTFERVMLGQLMRM